jgi:hypothetical protein
VQISFNPLYTEALLKSGAAAQQPTGNGSSKPAPAEVGSAVPAWKAAGCHKSYMRVVVMVVGHGCLPVTCLLLVMMLLTTLLCPDHRLFMNDGHFSSNGARYV